MLRRTFAKTVAALAGLPSVGDAEDGEARDYTHFTKEEARAVGKQIESEIVHPDDRDIIESVYPRKLRVVIISQSGIPEKTISQAKARDDLQVERISHRNITSSNDTYNVMISLTTDAIVHVNT